jgi:hypothetical protein
MDRLRGCGMEILAGVLELQFLGNLLWLAVSVPLFLSLGVATFVGVRRSRSEATKSGAERAPEFSRLGRSAMLAAFAVVGLMCLTGIGIAWAASRADAGSATTTVVVVTMALVLAVDIASSVLVCIFVALSRDVNTERRVAGWSAVIAYLTVAAGYSVIIGAVAGAGMYAGLVPR